MGKIWDGVQSIRDQKAAVAEERAFKQAVNSTGKQLKKLTRRLPTVEGGEGLGVEVAQHYEALKAARDAHKAALKTGVGVAEATKTLGDAHKAAAPVLEKASGFVSDAKSFARGERIGKIITNKPLMIATAATAAIIALVKHSSNKAKRERAEEVANREQQLAAMREETNMIRGANTMMGMTPTPGDHAARVLSARNGMAVGLDTSNPPVDMNYQVVR